MVLEKGRIFDDLNDHRHTRDLAQIEAFRDYKAMELKTLQDERDKTDAEYMAMKDLQDLIT